MDIASQPQKPITMVLQIEEENNIGNKYIIIQR